MKKIKLYFSLLKIAFKQETEFKINFIMWIFTMILNDLLWILLFIIFLKYFVNSWLSLADFLITYAFATTYYGLIHWLMKNFWELNDIIEWWKLDYYLWFPIDSLLLIVSRNIWVFAMWDIFFGLLCIIIYIAIYAQLSILLLLTWFLVIVITCFFTFWIYLIVWSLSFWFDKWSELKDIFEMVFVGFSMYPPKLFENKLFIFVIISWFWMYPAYFLPFKMIRYWSSLFDWLVLIWVSILTFFISLLIFKRWLQKYSSWNLIMQS